MKHIVFLTENYYPNYSAVSNCAEKIIDLLKERYDISVISVIDNSELSSHEYFNNYQIYRINRPYQDKLNIIRYNENNKSKFVLKGKLFLTRLVNLVKFLFKKESIDKDFIKAYFDKISEIHKNKKVDIVVPLVFPFETVLSSIEFKKIIHSNVIIVPYIFDNFSNSVSLHRFNLNRKIKFRANLNLERSMVKFSSKILAMHPLREHFLKNGLDDSNKIVYLEHPLLEDKSCSISRENKKDIITRVTYTGGLFRGVRTADICLKLLDAISKEIFLKVDFYCFGNDMRSVKSYSQSNPEVFFNHGRVSKSEAEQAISISDFLISIGDVEGKQLSSKIFDYLSMGKPIIHFSYVEDCVNAQFLKKYPLSFVIYQRDLELNFKETAVKATNFFTRVKNERCEFFEVSKIYPEALPQYTVNTIVEIVESDISFSEVH
ncbi:glycosyltransferase family protein [Vibrio porteresiae]|uniref:Glycosyltransferase n=1 Tax=Vibrio porteresiae DSM 19223 TaxID=1123496 RepID=A0ABZ0QCR8_9VIBR|nr:hypothetical protein [Vibrio porteresiae]WPC74249.1 hypothetical protein R8Z52_03020 [Vibrio porteresiae DSM 19223]